MNKRQLKLAAYLVGSGMHVASWKHPDAEPNASIQLEALIHQAKIAEMGKFDLAFIADSLAINHESHPQILNRFEPLTLITALSQATKRIGFGATASTTYSEPYVLARQFASVDHLSNGRSGWNVVTTADATGETAQNFSRDHHVEHDQRYERAEEFVDVVKGLWNSWEDDAFPYDKDSGEFYQKDKVHEVNFKGKFFQVKGPLNIGRSKQGYPVIIQAGASEKGQKLAARTAEVIFTSWDSMEKSKEYYRSIKNRLKDYHRAENELVVLHAASPIIGETMKEAYENHRSLQSLIDPYEALKFVSGYMGNVDFSKYSLDTPAIEVDFPIVNSIQSNFTEMYEIIQNEDLQVKDLYGRFFTAGRHDAFVGTPQSIADEMERWLLEKATDGFMIQFPVLPKHLEEFVEKVVPILQAKGIYRKDYEGDTLREHLGLEIPANSFV